MSDNHLIKHHKRLAMGESPAKMGYAKGGHIMPSTQPMKSAVPALKTGMKDNPLETLKRSNGIPGMKKGGRV